MPDIPDPSISPALTPSASFTSSAVNESSPLQHRIWQLYCDGETYSSIAGRLRLDRQTVTRHVHAVQQLLAQEHTASLQMARLRAVEAQLALQARALQSLAAEEQHEADALSDPQHHQPYRAQRGRLLTVAGTAAFRAARLLGLLDQLPPAPDAPHEHGPRTILIVKDDPAAPAPESTAAPTGMPAPTDEAPPCSEQSGQAPSSSSTQPLSSRTASCAATDQADDYQRNASARPSPPAPSPARFSRAMHGAQPAMHGAEPDDPASPVASCGMLDGQLPTSSSASTASHAPTLSLASSPSSPSAASSPASIPPCLLSLRASSSPSSLRVSSPHVSASSAVTPASEHRLHPAQHAFVTSLAPFAFYVGGVGAGKTFAGALRAILRAQALPGSLGLIGAPTARMLRDATVRTLFDLLPPDLLAAYHRTDGRLTLANGAEILLRSLDDPDRVRGLNLAWFWLDEAPWCGHYAWRLLKGRLRQSGIPSAQLAGWATGTPRGRDGYARDFELAPLPGHVLFRGATSDNARHLPPGYLDYLMQTYHGAFAEQELLGLFTAFAGLVYHIDTTSPPPAGHLRAPYPAATFSRVIGGIDWGYTNPTAALVFGLDADNRAWQLAEYYRRRITLEAEVLPALLDLTRRHGVLVWYADPSQPAYLQALNTALARAGLPCRAQPARNDLLPGIQTVTSALALRPDGTRGLYIHPVCTHTLAEYQTYAYPSSPDDDGAADQESALPSPRRGAASAEVPLKAADHAMDATRYALHSELTDHARTEAYLADLARWVELRRLPGPLARPPAPC